MTEPATDGHQPRERMPQLIGLEYIVDDLDRVLELFVDLLGFEVVARGPHPEVDAEVVTLDAGAIAINLLHRTAVGDRPQILDPEVALTQLLFSVPGQGDLDALRTRLVEAGTSVVVDAADTIHLTTQGARAIFGVAPTLVFRTELPDGDAVDDEPADA